MSAFHNLKECGHNNCMLSLSTCCACSDLRPHLPAYPVYIDGVGHSMTGTRNHDYCPTCKDGPATTQPAATLVPQAVLVLRKACGHDDCFLSASIPNCCACGDPRLLAAGGCLGYHDGGGDAHSHARNRHYCFSCKERTTSPEQLQPVGKVCGHQSCLLSTLLCCVCIDQRPIRAGYAAYQDGVGHTMSHTRRAHYCGACTDKKPIPFMGKICGHTTCLLSTMTCCACTDRRPHLPAYPVYVDGLGETMSGTRDHDYCPACKGPPHTVIHYPARRTSQVYDHDSDGDSLLNVPLLQGEPIDRAVVANYGTVSVTAATKECGHLQCHLTISKCCACMDKRPFTNGYPVHLDGQGIVMTGARNEHYCPGCKHVLPLPRNIIPVPPPSPASTDRSESLRKALHTIISGASSVGRSVAACLPRRSFKAKGKISQTDEFMIDNGCILCYEKHREVVFDPCHHLVVCEACANLIFEEADEEGEQARCPICRKEIDYYFQVFQP